MTHRSTLRTQAGKGATLVLSGAAALTLAACSGGSGGAGKATSTAGGSGSSTGSRVASITVTSAQGCAANSRTLPAGALTFKITNKDATAVSEVELLDGERILGEKENIPPGFGGQFAVNVPAGSYTLYCPGATPERTTVKVTGTAAGPQNDTIAALLQQGTKAYGQYIATQVDELVSAVNKLNTALHGTNLAAAQKAYIQARPYYEKIEPVAESFVIGTDSIDADIDVRIADTSFAKWRGFHRIEYGIFKAKSLKGMGTFGDKLVSDVARLKKLTTGLTYKPTELANGAQGLLDEVASSKITGEEEAYSGVDLLDFANNDEAAEQAFAQLEPALKKIDPALTSLIAARFKALDTLVDKYRTTSNPSGYRLYSSLTAADKRGFAAAVKAVQEPLSKVASKVANA